MQQISMAKRTEDGQQQDSGASTRHVSALVAFAAPMYVYMYICTYIYIYTCIYIHICICAYICVYIHMYVHIYVYMNTYVYIYIHR